MSTKAWLVAVLVAGSMLCGAAGSSSAFSAELPPPVPVPGLQIPDGIYLGASSRAGIAYAMRFTNGPNRSFVKAPGAAPVELPSGFGAAKMSGRLLLDSSATRYVYWDGPVRTCSDGHSGPDRIATPTGWASYNTEERVVMLTSVGEPGCSTRNFLPPTAPGASQRVVAADEDGLLIRSLTPDIGYYQHDYYRYDDPAHPVRLDLPATDSELRIFAGAVLFSTYYQDSFRVPLDGGPRQKLSAGATPWAAMTRTQVGVVDDQGPLLTAGFFGGPVRSTPVVGSGILSDGERFYTLNGPDQPPGIYSRVTADGPTRLEVPYSGPTRTAGQFAIALSPGRVHDAAVETGGFSSYPPYTALVRSVTNGTTFGPPTRFTPSRYSPIAASAGRFWFGGLTQRTHAGLLRPVPQPATNPIEASGNRVLVHDQVFTGDFNTHVTWRDLYDVRTGRLANPGNQGLWPGGAQAIFANMLVYAKPNGSVWRRDLASGQELMLRGTGDNVLAVAVHGRWVAWVTGCPPIVVTDPLAPQADVPCPKQRLTVRDLSSTFTRTWATVGTTALDLSGGYLALDTGNGLREVRIISLPAGVISIVDAIPAREDRGAVDYAHFNTYPRHFDLDDETLGWVDDEQVARVVKLPAFVEPPIYLGNVIAPTSFTPDGDGLADVWTMQFPVSKAMPTCTVKFYRGTTPVRFLSCAHTTGMATATWDGRTGSGARLPAGRYTYRVNGYESDGWLRHTDLTLTPMTGSVVLS